LACTPAHRGLLFRALVLIGVAAPAGTGQLKTDETAPNLEHPCGTLTSKTVVDEVLLMWEENHGYSSIIGNPGAPEMNGFRPPRAGWRPSVVCAPSAS
jgi:hypothetical protein